MKKIEAFIKSHLLDELILTMQGIDGVHGLTITDVRGFGRGRPDGKRRIRNNTKVEVFCSDELAETVVSTIEKSAHTGLRSDGKVYVIPVEEAVRISTGERGDNAV
jgi:nitrogen regulatory protein P-II 1